MQVSVCKELKYSPCMCIDTHYFSIILDRPLRFHGFSSTSGAHGGQGRLTGGKPPCSLHCKTWSSINKIKSLYPSLHVFIVIVILLERKGEAN
jgi:hypothetical protein